MIDLLGRRHHWHESTYRAASHLTSPCNLQVGKQWHREGGGDAKEEAEDKVAEEEEQGERRVENDNEGEEKEGGVEE